MKKYRIVEQSLLGGNKTYIPQVKESGIWGFYMFMPWCNFRKSLTEVKVFDSFNDAKEFIDSIKKDIIISKRVVKL